MCKGICAVLSVTKAVSGSLFSVEKLRRITALKNDIFEVNHFPLWIENLIILAGLEPFS